MRAIRDERRAFTIAELLVVIGIISLLLALMLPPLQLARQQAMQTQCSAQLQNMGRGLEQGRVESGFYPLPDDKGAPVRYTWIDVLVQRRYLTPLFDGPNKKPPGSGPTLEKSSLGAGLRMAYCPSDPMPDPLNEARHPDLSYPWNAGVHGVDYSFGISATLSAGGWAWRPSGASGAEPFSRRFRDYEVQTSGRVLAGDANTTSIFNLSGYAIKTGIWNQPTQYDNTVAWNRHGGVAGRPATANMLFQDGHGATISYDLLSPLPVNTSRTFVWLPGEEIGVNPDSVKDGYAYPNQPPPNFTSTPKGDVYPDDMNPAWYTATKGWTLVGHK